MLSRYPWFTRYKDRKLEWLLAFYTLWFGLWVSLPPHSMSGPSFEEALAIAPEWIWGVVYSLVGVVHIISLHVNGRGWWTPFARLFALFLNSQVFLALTIGLAQQNPWGTGVGNYVFIAFGFCGAAFYSASLDCGQEIKIWRARNAGN